MIFKSWKVWSSQHLTEDHQKMMETVMVNDGEWESIEHQMKTTFNLEVVKEYQPIWTRFDCIVVLSIIFVALLIFL